VWLLCEPGFSCPPVPGQAPAHLHMALDKHGSRSTHGANHMILTTNSAGNRRADLSLRQSKASGSG